MLLTKYRPVSSDNEFVELVSGSSGAAHEHDSEQPAESNDAEPPVDALPSEERQTLHVVHEYVFLESVDGLLHRIVIMCVPDVPLLEFVFLALV